MNDPAIVTGVFTILGVAIGSITTFAIASRTARLENQRQIRELGIKLAMVHFDHHIKIGQALADATGETVKTKPLPIFVAEGIKIAEIISDPSLNAYEIGIKLSGLTVFAKTVERGIDAHK